MKNIFLIIMMMFGCASHSQITFFVKPIIQEKLYISSLRIDKKFGFSNIQSHNDYFSFSNKAISSRTGYIPIGLGVGIALFDNTHIFSIGFVQDGVGSSMRTTSLYKVPFDFENNIPVYSEFTTFNQSLHFALRYFLDYQIRINKGLKNKLFFNTSLSYLHVNENNQFQNVIIGDMSEENAPIFFHNNSILLQTEYGSNASSGSFMIGVGMSYDFGLLIKKKWCYLLSLSIDYKQGLNHGIQYGYNNYIVKDKSNIFCFHYETQSRGSGIYFELSRRFQLYPWKKKNKT